MITRLRLVRLARGAAGVLALGAMSAGFAPGETGPGGQADQPAGAIRHAVPRLIARTSAARPGGTVELGVTFEIDPGWHLYWNGRNDSGMPITVTLNLPEGWTARPVLWPAPVRHLSPGNIVDHIYENRVTLVIPVRVPETAQVGAEAKVSARVEWMECERRCLLAGEEVSLALPVGAAEAPASPDAPLFTEALARVPAPLPERPVDVSLEWEGDVLRVGSRGAAYLGFYPSAEGVALADPGADGESKTGELKLRFEWGAGTAPSGGAGERVRGVLEVRRPGVKDAFYTVDLGRGARGG